MHNLDHFVMPVANLTSARERYTQLGFTVAANASHPFGTQNCCIFFSDGTFIEPLAIGNPAAYDEASANKNAFVAGHKAFTAKCGLEGFSHLVVKSVDARAEHQSYLNQSIIGGDILDFGRVFTKADGTLGEVAFRLAFAEAGQSSDARFFACEVVKAVAGGRGTLVNHANGVTRTKRVVISAETPSNFERFFAQFLDAAPKSKDDGVVFSTDSGDVEIMTPGALHRIYGLMAAASLQLQALVLQVADLSATRVMLAKNNIRVHDTDDRIIIPPPLGQGGTLVFEE
jgi:Glyoxalase-like domain